MHVLFPCRCAMIWIFSACWRDWNFYFEGFLCFFLFSRSHFMSTFFELFFATVECCRRLRHRYQNERHHFVMNSDEKTTNVNEVKWGSFEELYLNRLNLSLSTHHTKRINNQNRIRKKTVRLCTRQRQKPRFPPGFTTNFFQLIRVLFLHSITFNCCVCFFFPSFSFSSAERIFNGQ